MRQGANLTSEMKTYNIFVLTVVKLVINDPENSQLIHFRSTLTLLETKELDLNRIFHTCLNFKQILMARFSENFYFGFAISVV